MATPAEQIHAVFRDWDKAGSGVISASQLRSVLVSIAGAALSEQDIDSLLLQIYGSFDAPSVDWRQFISFICQSNAPSGADSPKASLKATDSATKPRKGASLLLKGLKSGEVGKLLDQMEDTEAPAPAPEKDTPPKDSPTSTSASTTAAPAPATTTTTTTTAAAAAPAAAEGQEAAAAATAATPESPQVGPRASKKGGALLLKGLRSGEVAKLVDEMEAAAQ
eukprot:CAMPEP_0206466666 /NCGR_PEP_ID=MMETSP0324_2-20121206/28591_1 /ASSEMBLY_ACC=CAM_ASM_000836 /TAXON_ID=2866 /ORGANISM="Crypthecodinium cohnii, Strain Seligo" /LENGTH=221 /DNA_ID=CAMNT_0053939819 /DNA_START=29 /DNA_END=694 /DNA_ORIENTATION=+